MRSCARLPKSSLFWQNMYLYCVLVYAKSPPVFQRLSFWQHVLYHSAKSTLRNISLLSSLLIHLRTLKIFSYQWLPVWLPKVLEANRYVPTVTYGLPNVNTSTHTFVRGILRERTNSPHLPELSPEKMDDATWAYSSTHAHRARLHTRCAVRVQYLRCLWPLAPVGI